jgi:hypothetical protein
MLQLHLINLVYLIILLAPGIVAGCIVTWHTRSALAIFKTIFASLAISFLVGVATLISGKVLAPLLSGMLGNWIMLIDFAPMPTSEFAWSLFSLDYLMQCYRYTIIAPIGTVAGAALYGMLLVVSHKLNSTPEKFDSSLGIIATVATTLLGGLMSLGSILSLSWLGWQGIHLATNIFSPNLWTSTWSIYTLYGVWGILILANALLCGLTCAFFGMKVARIFT